MTALIVALIVQWLVLVALGIVCLSLARQIGVLHQRIAPAGALMLAQKSIAVGDPAPSFSLKTVLGKSVSISAENTDRSLLIFFVAPDCPVCKSLLPILKSCAKAERSWLDVMLASDGTESDHIAFIQRAELEDFDYVVSEELGRSFAVSKLPYAVLIGEKGTIESFGLVNSREHLESLFEAKERNVASLQEYLHKVS
jgi:methylamine dehydrogenase accessory protein MauD